MRNVWDEELRSQVKWFIRTRLLRTLAQRHKFGTHGDALGDLHANHRFERFQFTGVGNGQPQQELFKGVLLADIFDGRLGADGGGARQNQYGMFRVQSSLQRDDRIVFRQGVVRRRRKKLLRFTRFWMKIDDLHGARAGPGSDLLEGEFLSGGQLQEGQIFRRRANEDEVVVLGVIQRKQATALDTNLLMKFAENAIESVNGQDFADSGVVIQDHRAGILGAIVVAHANVGPADEGGVAEDHPRFLRAGKEAFPENPKSNRQIQALAGQPGFRGFSRQESVRGDSDGGGEEDGQHHYRDEPPARGLTQIRQSI